MEEAFESDYAIVKAWKGDTDGNLIFKATARNFNPMMAMAGKITIAEVEELLQSLTHLQATGLELFPVAVMKKWLGLVKERGQAQKRARARKKERPAWLGISRNPEQEKGKKS